MISNIKKSDYVVLYDTENIPFCFCKIEDIDNLFIIVKGVNFSKINGEISSIQNDFSDKWINHKSSKYLKYPAFKDICSRIEIFNYSLLERKHVTEEIYFDFDNHTLEEIIILFPEKINSLHIPKKSNILNINNSGLLIEYYVTETIEDCNERFFEDIKLKIVN
jgi:hypothetical protein